MWQEVLGVNVTLSNQDWNVFLDSRKQGQFQIARNGWIADYNDACSFLDMWYTDGGNNDTQYSNPEYDALIDAAKATTVPEERMEAFHKAEDILIGQDSVLAPLYFFYRHSLTCWLTILKACTILLLDTSSLVIPLRNN